MVHSRHGTLMPWYTHAMVHSCHGTLTPWYTHTMVHSRHVTLMPWYTHAMVHSRHAPTPRTLPGGRGGRVSANKQAEDPTAVGHVGLTQDGLG